MSLRWRLALLFAAGTAAVVAVAGLAFIWQLRVSLNAALDDTLQARAHAVAAQVATARPLAGHGQASGGQDSGGSQDSGDSQSSGSQVQFCRGADALAQFAQRARVPIYVNGAARGALPPTHPNLFVNSRRQALGQAA